MSWELRLLGGFMLASAGTPIALPTRKTAALIGYLARQPRRQTTRETLAMLLWGDVDSEQARTNLRQALSSVRRLGDGSDTPLILTEGDTVRLASNISIDTDLLEDACRNAKASVVDPLPLYPGDFLHGFAIKNASSFSEWMELERQRLRELGMGILLAALDKTVAVESGSETTMRLGLRVLACEPFEERAHRAIMRSFARQGRHAEAVRHYRSFAEQLAGELQVTPSAETQALYRSLASRRDNGASPLTAAPVAIPSNATAPSKRTSNLKPRTDIRDTKRFARTPWIAIIAAAAFILAVAGAANWLISGRSTPAPEVGSTFAVMRAQELVKPALSPDGTRIAYSIGRTTGSNIDLYVRTIEPAKPIRLTTDPAVDDRPAWAPDHKRLAWVRRENTSGSPCRIMAMVVPDGREQELGRCRHASTTSLAWMPKGDALIYSDRDDPAGPLRLYRLELATGKVTPLTSPPSYIAGDDDPKVSSDGRRVAFLRRHSFTSADVRILDLQTRRLQAVTENGQRIWSIAWAPDEQGLIVSSSFGGDIGLWWLDLDRRTSPQRLSIGLKEFRGLSAARSGRRMIFEALRDDTTIEAGDGTSSLPPFPDNNPSGWFPTAAQDGSLAFVSNRSGQEQLWITDSRGTRPLTRRKNWTLQEPRWSPDSQHIAFTGFEEGRSSLYVMGRNDSAPRRIFYIAAEMGSPFWSNDGRALFFASRQSGRWRLWRLGFGRERTSLTAATGQGVRAGRISGNHLYTLKDDRPGLWRQRLAHDGVTPLGTPTRVLNDLLPSDAMNWDVVGETIYYVSRPADGAGGMVRRVDANGRSRDLMPTTYLWSNAAFSVTPNKQLILTRRKLEVEVMGMDFTD